MIYILLVQIIDWVKRVCQPSDSKVGAWFPVSER